jgi:ankyrin repeat protein
MLIDAVEKKDFNAIKLIIQNDKLAVHEIDSSGRSALHIIAKKGHYQYPPSEIPLLLIQNGIDLNAVDKDGNTALVISLLSGWQKIAMILLDNGADKSCVTNDIKSRITCPDCKRVVTQYGL